MKTYKLPLIDGREIVFRSINAEDADRYYHAIVSLPQNLSQEEYIFNLITNNVYAERLDTLGAGIILLVITAAFHYSGVLTEIEEFPQLVDNAREKLVFSAYNLLYIPILKAMPSYKMKELEDMSLNELLKLYAIAERIIGKYEIDTNDLRETLGVEKIKNDKASGKYADRQGKGVALVEDKNVLNSLTAALNEMQKADFDEYGKYIGDGNLL